MTVLLDTHFLIWIALASPRLKDFPWLERYSPWGVSPISFLEIELLSEVGRLEVAAGFMEGVASDERFVIDELSLSSLVRHAIASSWTRDPFDRLLVAHSAARRLPLCTMDRTIRSNHRLLPRELRPDRA